MRTDALGGQWAAAQAHSTAPRVEVVQSRIEEHTPRGVCHYRVFQLKKR